MTMSETLPNIVRGDTRIAPTAGLHVEVIADLICPFCFLGKRRLDSAMQAVQGPSGVSWHPYQLNPDMPPAGVGYEEYLSRRFGNMANVQPVLDGLVAEGQQEGIDFRFDLIRQVPNTLPVHQVMHHAEIAAKDQSALAEDLMTSFFVRGENIGDRDVLLEVAGRHGIDAADAQRAIDDSKTKDIVLAREAQVRSSGLAGVPGFLVNRRLLVIGAQESDNLVNAFDRAMFGEGDDELGSPTLH